MVFTDLYAFRLYGSREEYARLTGKPCPPYNPDRPIKRWEDLSAAGRTAKYTVWDDDEKALIPLTVAGEVARAVNIPHGLPQEPTSGEYAVPLKPVPQGFTIQAGLMGPMLVSMEDLAQQKATKADVDKIAAVLGRLEKKIDALARKK